MFEAASRQKLRFETSKGLLSAEDLWDLPLTSTTGKVNLDEIALGLHKQLRSVSDVVSFVEDTAATDPTVQMRFEIVKHVIETRKRENAEALASKAKTERRRQIQEVLSRKRENALEEKSEAELLQELATL